MRSKQLLLLASLLPLCWLLMQVVHEAGHILAAVATGGKVTKVVLHPLAISRTDVSPNPVPLVVVWAGPLLGTAIPLGLFFLARQTKWQAAFLLRFFAGFCSIANGLYIGVGSFQGIGDAGEMLQLGSPRWSLWLTGLGLRSTRLSAMEPARFFLWLWQTAARDFAASGLGNFCDAGYRGGARTFLQPHCLVDRNHV